ncbi:MAG: adenylate/guanylate cyclase domain-containing protein [Croceivirga sp.]
MERIKNHIVLTLIAAGTTNLYFLLWFLFNDGQFPETIYQGLSFNGFFLMVNISILLVSMVTMGFNQLGDRMRALGFGSGTRLTVKTSITVLLLVLFIAMGLFLKFTVFQDLQTETALNRTWIILNMPKFRALMLFFMVISILMFFISNLERRMGNVYRLFSQSMGKAIHPKLSEKGFMFVDLNDATTIAERLGSETYANLLRDCFDMLNELVATTPFEIYQFVGDEAVITWDTWIPSSDRKALDLFCDFKGYLEENGRYFERYYHLRPYFKCAIHSGPAVQSEIGKEKMHLVYHGDVLNTTSRLLGQCHFQNTDIIISETAVVQKQHLENKYELWPMEYTNLKGKSKPVKAYVVRERSVKKDIRDTSSEFFLSQKMTVSQII